jgi:hypothetical protein
LAAALPLYLVRLLAYNLNQQLNGLIGLESMCWMLAILGFGSLYLNKPSRRLISLIVGTFVVGNCGQPRDDHDESDKTGTSLQGDRVMR